MHMFDDIRPYNDSEIHDAMQRIASDPSFPILASYVFPDKTVEEVQKTIQGIDNIRDFQIGIMHQVNKRITGESISELSFGGMEHIDRNTQYLYVSNHRDIMLDASLLQSILIDNQLDTTYITFGANLMKGQLVIDIGKSNKMFRVERPGENIREFYRASMHLSEYIRTVLLRERQSVWIAQRNGRTKDGIDRTDQGIINMFRMSCPQDRLRSVSDLNILPVSVSYEWEPCDVLKTLELYARLKGPYKKSQGEDLKSILTGIMQPKGKVHIQFCRPLSEPELLPYTSLSSKEFNRCIAGLIDKRICSEYRLTPNNYIAHDLRSGSGLYSTYYTSEQKQNFLQHMSCLEEYADACDLEILRSIYLGIYANPVDSRQMFID